MAVTIVGGGPAGLMAAEALLERGVAVDLYDGMPSVGRKFLLAGKGGLNLTHSERRPAFDQRYGPRTAQIARLLDAFDADGLRAWAGDLGVETFVGTSGRVFPKEFKSAPLLRAWLHRLRARGLRIHVRHRWLGWGDDGALQFATPAGHASHRADALVLALGGASWSRLGSDGAWVPLLERCGVGVAPLRPANCGFEVAWSEHFRERHAGKPVKSVRGIVVDARGIEHWAQGEAVVTAYGIEGGLVYALSSTLRDTLETTGSATLDLDLAPARSEERLAAALAKPRGSQSFANHLRARAGIDGVKAGLLREALPADALGNAARVARTIKRLPIRVLAARPIDEAISTAGGVPFEALDERLMLRAQPGVFIAGEMLDWEAPTGGYLLTACFASGHVAGRGAAEFLRAG
jgi:uncharacterized flavoprotein (TIGR03862 family)